MTGVIKTCGSGLASENTILDVGFAHAVHRRIVLVAAAAERNISSNAGGQVVQTAFPCRITVSISATGIHHVEEHPVFKLHEERVITPAKVIVLGSGLQTCLRTLDGIATPGQHSVQGKNIDGNLTLLIEVGELLDAQRVLVLHPALEDCAAAVVPGIAVTVTYITEPEEYSSDSATVNAEVRDVDFQNISGLVLRRLRIVGKLRVEDYEVLLLMGLEGYLASPEIVTCRVEFIALLVDYTRPKDLGRLHIISATMGESDFGRVSVRSPVEPNDIGLGHQLAVRSVAASKSPGSAPQLLR